MVAAMSDMKNDSADIDFGFERIPVGEKQGRVRSVFDSVASNYDLMNDAMSGGIHRIWKTVFLDWLNPRPGQILLDVAGGTGDISRGFLKRGGAKAIVCDINHEMVRVGAEQETRRPDCQSIEWLCGNAEVLPVPDRAVDAYTITFGIRNVTHRDRALEEALRVLKPGGRFLCMEFSMPEVPGLDRIYDIYSFNVLPKLGKLLANDEESYRYLAESIRAFPEPAAFEDMVRAAGFGQVSRRMLSGGIAHIYSGWRI